MVTSFIVIFYNEAYDNRVEGRQSDSIVMSVRFEQKPAKQKICTPFTKEMILMNNKPLSLKHLIEAMNWEADFASTFFWVAENDFITIDNEVQSWVEDKLDSKDAPEWMQKQIQHAKVINESYLIDYFPLPDKFDMNEHSMMKRFLNRVNDVDSARQLDDVIGGRGNFRKFKALAEDLGLIDQWVGFRTVWYKDIAIGWCEKHHLSYEDDTGK